MRQLAATAIVYSSVQSQDECSCYRAYIQALTPLRLLFALGFASIPSLAQARRALRLGELGLKSSVQLTGKTPNSNSS